MTPSRLPHARRLMLAALLTTAVARIAAQEAPPSDPRKAIDDLGNFDHDIRTRAARALRRVPAPQAVPLLVEAIGSHRDGYVRYRALVLLAGFNDPGMPPRVRGLLGDTNDRIREAAYAWLERHPDSATVPVLLPALETETAEFVRPALVRALAASGSDPQVQRALVREVGRGLDIFRSAVIDALGEYRAEYGVDAIADVAKHDGPLRDDAILALGKIGGARSAATLASLRDVPGELAMAVRGALCLAGTGCAEHLAAAAGLLADSAASADAVRYVAASLAALGARGNHDALSALVHAARSRQDAASEEAALGLATAALRQPAAIMSWLKARDAAGREQAVAVLRDGFDMLQEDFAEEAFFAAARAAYWNAPEGSTLRSVSAALIQKLGF